MNAVTKNVEYALLAQAARDNDAVVLTEHDYARLMHYGRVFVKLPDNSKYTKYRRYICQEGDVVAACFITTKVGDQGIRAIVYVRIDGSVIPPSFAHNLIPFDGIHLPAVHSNYAGASWR